ncbi:MAG: response regulator [Candidatus Marinimicrobia bacterium]|nr:response regulator [Candidatus Neomarinimicrobiota bacterium]
MENISILIVEDDMISREYLYEILHGKNINILMATTGKEAIEVCRNNLQIDIVLMDIKMPELDGLEATKEIKAFRPDLPIIAQTAYALNGERVTILKSGCDDYLSKPIYREDLLAIIQKHVYAHKGLGSI